MENLDHSMTAAEEHPLILEHTRLLQAFASCRVVLKEVIENDKRAIDLWNNDKRALFQQRWAATTTLLEVMLKILNEALEDEKK